MAAGRRAKSWFVLLAALGLCIALAAPGAAGYIGDDDSDQPNQGFGAADSSAGSPTEIHYHLHNHYHSPYLSHSDSAPLPGFSQAAAQPFAPSGVAGANRYYAPSYLNSSRTPAPPSRFLGDREDADPTEILDSPGYDEAASNDEVGENVDQPATQMASDSAGEIVDSPRASNGPRALPGDRGYLRVIVPMPGTKLIYDGHEVPGTGVLRSLMTARIPAGESQAYTLVAYWKDSTGHPRVSVHEASISAGDHQTVQFNVATGN